MDCEHNSITEVVGSISEEDQSIMSDSTRKMYFLHSPAAIVVGEVFRAVRH